MHEAHRIFSKLQVLRSTPVSYPFTRGLVYDPWVDPILPIASSSSTSSPAPPADSLEVIGTDITVPLLVINSEAFTLWQDHFNGLRDIVVGVKNDADAWLITLGSSLPPSLPFHPFFGGVIMVSYAQKLVGSIHLSFSDLPLIQPFIARRAGARVNSKEATAIFVEASMEFFSGDGKTSGILGRKVEREEDLNGARSHEQRENKMEPVGEIRVHVSP